MEGKQDGGETNDANDAVDGMTNGIMGIVLGPNRTEQEEAMEQEHDRQADVGDEQDESESESAGSHESDETSDYSDEDESWVNWYCSLKGNEFFCEVDADYIDDPFNLYGLSDIPYFNEALDIILDLDVDLDEQYPPDTEERRMVENAAELAYGLIHARFIITNYGMEMMMDKFQDGDFGECLRIQCERQSLLPIGLSDVPREATVKTFCPRCREIYLPTKERQRGLDGAYFGRTFPHLFLLRYPQDFPREPVVERFVPTIFGFKIHDSSAYWHGLEEGKRKQMLLNKETDSAANDKPQTEQAKQQQHQEMEGDTLVKSAEKAPSPSSKRHRNEDESKFASQPPVPPPATVPIQDEGQAVNEGKIG